MDKSLKESANTGALALITSSTVNSRIIVVEEALSNVTEVYKESLTHQLDDAFTLTYELYYEKETQLKKLLNLSEKDITETDWELINKLMELGILKALDKPDAVLAVFANCNKKITTATTQAVIDLFA